MNDLHELVDAVRSGSKLEVCLGDFLDAFYLRPAIERMAELPSPLSSVVPNGDMIDAFLAATAEYLARRYRLSIPLWVFEPCRYLKHPSFPTQSASFRVTLLLESPMEFRSRNLFVTANALSRASQFATREGA